MSILDRALSAVGLERRDSQAAQARVVGRVGRPVYRASMVSGNGADPRQYAPEAMQSVVAFVAVQMVAKSFASVQWDIKRQLRDGTLEDAAQPDLQELWGRTDPLTSGAQFRAQLATNLTIYGEAPVERFLLGQRPAELYAVEPYAVGVVPGRTGMPQEYTYKQSGREVRFPVNVATGDCDLLFIKTYNPADHWRGLAPTVAAAKDIDGSNAGKEWNAALLQNAAQPSGLLVSPDSLTDEQRSRLQQVLREQYSGAQNAGKPMVAEAGLDWKAMGLTPNEMSWLEGNREAARNIAMAYGVPPMLLGIPGDNTYSNFREARLAFYDDTIIPMLRLVADEMNRWLTPRFGEGLQLRPDIEGIEALDFRMERRFAMVQGADFLTVDEKRAALGYEPLGEERGGDMVPTVQQYGAVMLDMDDDPESAGRRAFGDGAS
jgi:HK97 family phage portal protein